MMEVEMFQNLKKNPQIWNTLIPSISDKGTQSILPTEQNVEGLRK
jgi:hypothetical protein